ncbi:MAG: DUF2339 domain-containing protein [Actinomycetota bacterium]|nr:DUF2339 domain-containing protein [Actinomycetota bacterium]
MNDNESLNDRIRRLERELEELRRGAAASSGERSEPPPPPSPPSAQRIPTGPPGPQYPGPGYLPASQGGDGPEHRAASPPRRQPVGPAAAPSSGSGAGTDFEDSVVGAWFPRIGALALLLAAGLGFKYAVDRGFLGPGLRVVLGVVLGFSLLAIGEVTRRRGWLAYAQAVSGGGLAVLYLTVWASFAIFEMVAAPVGFVLLLVVVMGGAALAVRQDSFALAALATVGGFLNPIVADPGALGGLGFLGYTVGLNLGIMALAFFRRWRALDRIAFAGTWMLYVVAGLDGRQAFVFATTTFLLFGAIPVLHAIRNKESQGRGDLVFLLLNAGVYYLASVWELSAIDSNLVPTFTFLLGAFELGLGVAIKVFFPNAEVLSQGPLIAAGALFTIWVPTAFAGQWVPALWALYGGGLVVLGRSLSVREVRVMGAAILGLSLAASLYIHGPLQNSLGQLEISEHWGAYLCQIVGFYAAAFAERNDPTEREWAVMACMSGHLLLLVWVSLETLARVYGSFEGQEAQRMLAFSLSSVWTIYASLLLIIGLIARLRATRFLAVAVFGLTLLKVTLHDLWLVQPFHRIVSFAGIGVLLLVCSLMYHRFRDLIVEGSPLSGRRLG